MLRLTCKIEISSAKTWTFDKVVAVEITRDYEALTGTCKITLPKKVKWQGEDANPLKRGDAVKVWLGYDDENTLWFTGYITTIGAKTPVVVTCEDEMWRLKTTPAVKKAYKSATIRQILDDQNLGYNINVMGEQGLGAYRVSVDNVAELLNAWKEQGIRSFFKYDADGVPTLYCGVLFEQQGGHVQVFDNHRNMISDDALNIQSAKDVKIRVKAVKDGKITLNSGDNGGLVIIQKLTDKINALVDTFNNHTHTLRPADVKVAGSPTAQQNPAPITVPAITGKASKLNKKDYENEDITH